MEIFGEGAGDVLLGGQAQFHQNLLQRRARLLLGLAEGLHVLAGDEAFGGGAGLAQGGVGFLFGEVAALDQDFTQRQGTRAGGAALDLLVLALAQQRWGDLVAVHFGDDLDELALLLEELKQQRLFAGAVDHL